MPEEAQNQNPPQDDDLLEKLLAGAAKREADKKMQELEQKGVVTKAEFSAALAEFGRQLTETITSAFSEQLKKAAPPEAAGQEGVEGQQPVQKAQRKGTIQASPDPFMDNPAKYLISKARKGEEYSDLERAVVWELTKKGFTQGMSFQDIDGADFADEYNPQ